jgi:cold shock CspA family protein
MRTLTGTITTLKDAGYGFVDGEDGVTRWFHQTYVKAPTSFNDLEIGDNVTFVPFVGPRGRRAEDVRRSKEKTLTRVGDNRGFGG